MMWDPPQAMSRACQALGIALELVVSDSPADLLRIALTCKLIAQLALPMLDRNVRVVATSERARADAKINALFGFILNADRSERVRTFAFEDPCSRPVLACHGAAINLVVQHLPCLTTVALPAGLLSSASLGLLHRKLTVVNLDITSFACQDFINDLFTSAGPVPASSRPAPARPLVLHKFVVSVPAKRWPETLASVHDYLEHLTKFYIQLESIELTYLPTTPVNTHQANAVAAKSPLVAAPSRLARPYYDHVHTVSLVVSNVSVFLGYTWLTAVAHLRKGVLRFVVKVVAREVDFEYGRLPMIPAWEPPLQQIGSFAAPGRPRRKSWRDIGLTETCAEYQRPDEGDNDSHPRIVKLRITFADGTEVTPEIVESLLGEHVQFANSLTELALDGGRWSPLIWPFLDKSVLASGLPLLENASVDGHVLLVLRKQAGQNRAASRTQYRALASLKSARSKFGSFPTEILAMIAEHSLKSDITGLARLGLTSRRMSEIVAPILGRVVRLIPGETRLETDTRINSFLRLLHDADRAARVRAFDVEDPLSRLVPACHGRVLELIHLRLPGLTSVSLAAPMLTNNTLAILLGKHTVTSLEITSYRGQYLPICPTRPSAVFVGPPRPIGAAPLALVGFIGHVESFSNPNKLATIDQFLFYVASHHIVCHRLGIDYRSATASSRSLLDIVKTQGALTRLRATPYFPELRTVSLEVDERSMQLGYAWLSGVFGRRVGLTRLVLTIVPAEQGGTFTLVGRQGLPSWRNGRMIAEGLKSNRCHWRSLEVTRVDAEYAFDKEDALSPFRMDTLRISFGTNETVRPHHIESLVLEDFGARLSLKEIRFDGGVWDPKVWFSDNMSFFSALTELKHISIHGHKLHPSWYTSDQTRTLLPPTGALPDLPDWPSSAPRLPSPSTL